MIMRCVNMRSFQYLRTFFQLPSTTLFLVLFTISASWQNEAKAFEFSGTFQATEAEIADHARSINQLALTTSSCLRRELDRHQSFYRSYGISPFYGSNSYFGKLSASGKRSYLSRKRLSPNLVSEMEMTSCVGFAIKCYQEGFKTTGQEAVWKRIASYLAKNNYDGSAMIEAFRVLGWQVAYWNPDTSKNNEWEAEEKRKDPTNNLRMWGYHHYRELMVNRKGMYYKNPVDDKETLVNFGTHVPYSFQKAPLFLGVAHTGYHVFPGTYGEVIEAHSTRQITDFNTVENAPFNPLQSGGAPRGNYRSGIVALPPGYFLNPLDRSPRVLVAEPVRPLRVATQDDWTRFSRTIERGSNADRMNLLGDLEFMSGRIADWALLILAVDKRSQLVRDQAYLVLSKRTADAKDFNLAWLYRYAGVAGRLGLTKSLEFIHGSKADRLLTHLVNDSNYEIRRVAQQIRRAR